MRLLLTNCQILKPDWTVIEGYLGIDGDTICYIGEDNPQEEYDRYKNLHGAIVMPGLINCHTHSPMVLMRGVGSNLPLQQWLFDTVFPIEDKLTAQDVAAGSRLALLEMIASGTTSFSDMYFFPWETIAAVGASGLKANVCRCIQSFSPAEVPADNRQIPESLDLFRNFHMAHEGRIRVDFSIHAEYTCQSQIVEAYSAICKEHGGRMHLHLAETAKEQQECIDKYGMTPAAWFEKLGTFDSPAAAAHCVALTEEDMQILKRHNVSVIHNPSSNMKLGSGFAPIRRMLDLGLNVTLGTDGAASNNNLNMFEEMHLAALLHNGYHQDPTHITVQDVLSMATCNGAKLQGRSDTGVLEVGKKADLIAISVDAPHMCPNLDPAALLVYSAQGSDVCLNMVDGRILYENGEFKTLDQEKIIHEAKASMSRLLG